MGVEITVFLKKIDEEIGRQILNQFFSGDSPGHYFFLDLILEQTIYAVWKWFFIPRLVTVIIIKQGKVGKVL